MSGTARRNAIVRIFMVAAYALVVPSSSFGQSPEPLLYRRVFVPEEALNNHIRGLLPLKREEFERRVALAAKQNDASAGKMAARIEQAARVEPVARIDAGGLR